MWSSVLLNMVDEILLLHYLLCKLANCVEIGLPMLVLLVLVQQVILDMTGVNFCHQSS